MSTETFKIAQEYVSKRKLPVTLKHLSDGKILAKYAKKLTPTSGEVMTLLWETPIGMALGLINIKRDAGL